MEKIFILFPFILAGMFALVSFIISKLGWGALAERFKFSGEFKGDDLGVISARINFANYNYVLNLKANNKGFFLRPIVIFRLFHPPLFIPWEQVAEVRDKKILFWNYKKLVIGAPEIAVIRIKVSTYEKLAPYFKHNP